MAIESTAAVDVVKVAMDMARMRAETAARNIAHGGTPGYAGTRLDFSEVVLGIQSHVGSRGAAPLVPASAARETALPDPVRLDEEVAELASASGRYQMLVEALNRHYALARLAVSGR